MNEPVVTMSKLYCIMIYFITMIVCSFGLDIKVSGYTVRPERVFAIILAILLITKVFAQGKIYRARSGGEYIFLWLFLGFLVSLLSAGASLSIRHWIDLTLAVFTFFLGSMVRLDKIFFIQLKPISWVAIFLGLGGVLVAIFNYFEFFASNSLVSFFITSEVGYSRVKMTMFEPNLYGAIMMVFSIISIAYWRQKSLHSFFFIVLSHAGLIISFSRGPIIGYFVGIIVYFMVAGYKKWAVLLVVLLSIILIIAPYALLKSSDYTANDGGLWMRYDSLTTRAVIIMLCLEDIAESPIYGNGVYSFSYLHPEVPELVGDESGKGAWIPSMPFAVFHDTGIIGLGFLVRFFVIIFRNGYHSIVKMRRCSIEIFTVRKMAGWFAAGSALLVTSIVTSAYSLAAFWVTMALISSITDAVNIRFLIRDKGVLL